MGSEVAFFALSALVIVRCLGALTLPITDCDETYNYWEPMHQLLFGSGLQTWEYSAHFGLRSWLFVWFYSWPAYLGLEYDLLEGLQQLLAANKVILFVGTKVFIAICCANVEGYFVGGVNQRFGARASVFTLAMLLVAPGVAQAAPAFLPSSFAMMCFFVAGGAWMRLDAGVNKTLNVSIMIFAVLSSALLGWPFAGLIGVPLGLYTLFKTPFFGAIANVIVSGALIVGATVMVDSEYYCKFPSFPPWSIVAYNIFGGEERGPHLYGVEPWNYFFKNLLLNFNIAFVAALAAPLLCLLNFRRCKSHLVFMSPFFLWFVFWMRIPHKEERFMVPAYPFLVLAAALGLDAFMLMPKKYVADNNKKATEIKTQPAAKLSGLYKFASFLVAIFMLVLIPLSLSRTYAIKEFYGGPQELALKFASLQKYTALATVNFDHLHSTAKHGDEEGVIPVCLGREWYRFPSSFATPIDHGQTSAALPTRTIGFFRNPTFNGALPLPFVNRPDATCVERTNMNDLNKEIPGQYVEADDIEKRCVFIFDSDNSAEEVDPSAPSADVFRDLMKTEAGQKSFAPVQIMQTRLLDATKTPTWCRMGYIPFGVTEKCAVWHKVGVWANTALLKEGTTPSA